MLARRSVLLCVGLATLLIGIVGCGGEERGPVSGQVTLDGQPVDGGEIRFLPSEGKPAWAQIVAGRYSIQASSGPSFGTARVEIRWSRKTGKQFPAIPPAPPGAMIEETVEAIPARFNTNSEINAQIKPGNNVLDFELKS